MMMKMSIQEIIYNNNDKSKRREQIGEFGDRFQFEHNQR